MSRNKLHERPLAHYSANCLLWSPAQQTNAGSLYRPASPRECVNVCVTFREGYHNSGSKACVPRWGPLHQQQRNPDCTLLLSLSLPSSSVPLLNAPVSINVIVASSGRGCCFPLVCVSDAVTTTLGVFTLMKRPTPSRAHTHQSVWQSCRLPPVASFVSASGCSLRRPCFCPCQQTSVRLLFFFSTPLTLSPPSSSTSLFPPLSISPHVVVYFPLSSLTSVPVPPVCLFSVQIQYITSLLISPSRYLSSPALDFVFVGVRAVDGQRFR